MYVDLLLLSKLEFTLVDELLQNIEKCEVLTIPLFFNKDSHTPSNTEHDVVSFVGE
jgi:hypothetical protein